MYFSTFGSHSVIGKMAVYIGEETTRVQKMKFTDNNMSTGTTE